jgi:predicted enzyme related to lactoylglutathione lyase
MSTHGTFLWNELATGDLRGAKNFYGKLLGWKTEEMKMADGSSYTVVKAAGGPAQGTGGMMQMPKEAGMPDGWLAYVAVDDVDAAVARARKLGGDVPLPPFDIEGVGRIAHVTDPSGARLGLIKPLPMEQPAPKSKSSTAKAKAKPQAKPKARAKSAGKPKARGTRRTSRG